MLPTSSIKASSSWWSKSFFDLTSPHIMLPQVKGAQKLKGECPFLAISWLHANPGITLSTFTLLKVSQNSQSRRANNKTAPSLLYLTHESLMCLG